jgi:hypothetical protein
VEHAVALICLPSQALAENMHRSPSLSSLRHGALLRCGAPGQCQRMITRVIRCQMVIARSSKTMRSRWRAGMSVAMS